MANREKDDFSDWFPDLEVKKTGPSSVGAALQGILNAIKANEDSRDPPPPSHQTHPTQPPLPGIPITPTTEPLNIERIFASAATLDLRVVQEPKTAHVSSSESGPRGEIHRAIGRYVHEAVNDLLVMLSWRVSGLPDSYSYPTRALERRQQTEGLRRAVTNRQPLPSLWKPPETAHDFLGEAYRVGTTDRGVIKFDNDAMRIAQDCIRKMEELLYNEGRSISRDAIPAELQWYYHSFADFVTPGTECSPVIIEPACMLTRKQGDAFLYVRVIPDWIMFGPNHTFIGSLKTGGRSSATSDAERGAYALMAASVELKLEPAYNYHYSLPSLAQVTGYFDRHYRFSIESAVKRLRAVSGKTDRSRPGRKIWMVEVYLNANTSQPAEYDVIPLSSIEGLKAKDEMMKYLSGEKSTSPHRSRKRTRKPTIG